MATYTGQGWLKLVVDTEQDISTATDLRIAYKKPSGTEGEWTGYLYTDNTSIYKDLSNADINEVGVWSFQAKFSIYGRGGKGNIINHSFDKPIY